jgi:hypothetical protein
MDADEREEGTKARRHEGTKGRAGRTASHDALCLGLSGLARFPGIGLRYAGGIALRRSLPWLTT